MVKRKVIEDSDDEGDLESPTKAAQVGNDNAIVETDDPISPKPVKLRLNDTEDEDKIEGHARMQWDPSRKISMSQPNAPATSKSTTMKSKRAKTLTDVDISETSTTSLESSKGTKSFDSSDIFEFQGEDGEEGGGPRKKRRRTQSQVEERNGHKLLQTPRHTLQVHHDATQTSTIPTIADTSPFQVPSMSSYLKDGDGETIQEEGVLVAQDIVTLAEPLKDSFEDELAAAYPPSVMKAPARPMVLVPGHHAENEEDEDLNTEHDDSMVRSSTKSRKKTVSAGDPRNLADELGSDDQGIGIPKDQYKPRPSRSRGRRQDREDDLVVPIDFSKRPEAAAKTRKKGKHLKSTQSGDPKIEVQEEANESIGLGEISSVQPAEENGHEEAKANEKPVEAIAQDSHKVETPMKPAKKPRGRPKKSTEIISRDGGAHGSEPAESKSVINASVTTKSASKEVKSKKSSSIVDSDSDSDDIDQKSKNEDQLEEAEEIKIKPFQELDPNSPKKRGRPSKTEEDALPKPKTPDKKAAAATPKGPDKHSPISKTGAVKFRVGLSKRARIEPLLRIVRK